MRTLEDGTILKNHWLDYLPDVDEDLDRLDHPGKFRKKAKPNYAICPGFKYLQNVPQDTLNEILNGFNRNLARCPAGGFGPAAGNPGATPAAPAAAGQPQQNAERNRLAQFLQTPAGRAFAAEVAAAQGAQAAGTPAAPGAAGTPAGNPGATPGTDGSVPFPYPFACPYMAQQMPNGFIPVQNEYLQAIQIPEVRAFGGAAAGGLAGWIMGGPILGAVGALGGGYVGGAGTRGIENIANGITRGIVYGVNTIRDVMREHYDRKERAADRVDRLAEWFARNRQAGTSGADGSAPLTGVYEPHPRTPAAPAATRVAGTPGEELTQEEIDELLGAAGAAAGTPAGTYRTPAEPDSEVPVADYAAPGTPGVVTGIKRRRPFGPSTRAFKKAYAAVDRLPRAAPGAAKPIDADDVLARAESIAAAEPAAPARAERASDRTYTREQIAGIIAEPAVPMSREEAMDYFAKQKAEAEKAGRGFLGRFYDNTIGRLLNPSAGADETSTPLAHNYAGTREMLAREPGLDEQYAENLAFKNRVRSLVERNKGNPKALRRIYENACKAAEKRGIREDELFDVKKYPQKVAIGKDTPRAYDMDSWLGDAEAPEGKKKGFLGRLYDSAKTRYHSWKSERAEAEKDREFTERFEDYQKSQRPLTLGDKATRNLCDNIERAGHNLGRAYGQTKRILFMDVGDILNGIGHGIKNAYNHTIKRAYESADKIKVEDVLKSIGHGIKHAARELKISCWNGPLSRLSPGAGCDVFSVRDEDEIEGDRASYRDIIKHYESKVPMDSEEVVNYFDNLSGKPIVDARKGRPLAGLSAVIASDEPVANPASRAGILSSVEDRYGDYESTVKLNRNRGSGKYL